MPLDRSMQVCLYITRWLTRPLPPHTHTYYVRTAEHWYSKIQVLFWGIRYGWTCSFTCTSCSFVATAKYCNNNIQTASACRTCCLAPPRLCKNWRLLRKILPRQPWNKPVKRVLHPLYSCQSWFRPHAATSCSDADPARATLNTFSSCFTAPTVDRCSVLIDFGLPYLLCICSLNYWSKHNARLLTICSRRRKLVLSSHRGGCHSQRVTQRFNVHRFPSSPFSPPHHHHHLLRVCPLTYVSAEGLVGWVGRVGEWCFKAESAATAVTAKAASPVSRWRQGDNTDIKQNIRIANKADFSVKEFHSWCRLQLIVLTR